MTKEDEAKLWLKKHAVLLGPEELPFEEEKLKEAYVTRKDCWPIPRPVEHMGVFSKISDRKSFDSIIGNPLNWNIVLNRSDLYHSWIIPKAILIFGKIWFASVQKRNSLRKHLSTIFGAEEQTKSGISFSDTLAGKYIIYRISLRIEHALDVYLSGGGISKNNGCLKKPSGYIIKSITNEFVHDSAIEAGFKSVRLPVCPNCLMTKKTKKNFVKHICNDIFKCEQCAEKKQQLEYFIKDKRDKNETINPRILSEYKISKSFCEFSGIVCICPNKSCQGYFVPISCIENPEWKLTREGKIAQEKISHMRILRGNNTFINPPEVLLNMPLCCPFCDEKFTIKKALSLSCGFRNQSGKLTGLPRISSWINKENEHIDDCIVHNYKDTKSLKECIVDDSIESPIENVAEKQRVEILMGEISIRSQKLKRAKTVPGVISYCFYRGIIRWMLKYPGDASRYFFNNNLRGRETKIHQEIINVWLTEINEHINKIRKIKNSKIHSLDDLKWFCRPPSYNMGPKIVFYSTVEEGLKIINRNYINILDESKKPRMAWISSVRKINNNILENLELRKYIKTHEWQSFYMDKKSGLNCGDSVKVTALIMPGHHCNAPIKRIIRLRTSVLSPIIDRIRLEEIKGETDIDFWKQWNEQAKIAKKSIGVEKLRSNLWKNK